MPCGNYSQEEAPDSSAVLSRHESEFPDEQLEKNCTLVRPACFGKTGRDTDATCRVAVEGSTSETVPKRPQATGEAVIVVVPGLDPRGRL